MLSRSNVLLAIKSFSVLASLFVLAYFYDFNNALDFFSDLNYYFLFISLFFIVGNQLLSSIRFKVSLYIFGVDLRIEDSNRINIYSLISGFVFFNFFGQSLSRSYLIGGSLGKESAFFLTAVERAVSVSVLLVAAISFSLLCFGGMSFDKSPAAMIFFVVFFVVVSLGCYFFFSLSDRQLEGVSQVFSKPVGGGLFWMLLITILMHLFMLASYLCLIIGVVGVDGLSVFAVLAALLTMLGASVPISFGGWGIREVTAGFAFNAASLPPELGVAVGVGVGLLTIVALGVNACGVWVGELFLSSKKNSKIPVSETGRKDSRVFISALAWVLPIFIFVLVMVQLPVPVGVGKLTVNLADPVVIVCGMTFIFVFSQRKMWSRSWEGDFCGHALIGIIFVICSGFLIGYFQHGFLSWAFYNRFIGAGLLGLYFVSGMALSSFWGQDGIIYIARLLAISVLIMLLCEYFARIFLQHESIYVLGWAFRRWFGLFGNPNAYAFFLVCCFPIVFIFSEVGKSWGQKFISYVPAAIFLVGIYYTGSRAAFVAMVVVVSFLSFSYWRKMIPTFVLAFILVGILSVSREIIYFFYDGAVVPHVAQDLIGSGFAAVQDDRMTSLREGWKLFLNSPIWGAGLGGFYYQQTNAGMPLVIHNSFLWVLAEFGLLGFIIIFGPIGMYAVKNLVNLTWCKNDRMYALLATLFGASIIGLAHEIMYQRILWLLLGVLLTNALPKEAIEKHSIPRS